MHPTIAQMLIQDHQHELEVESARVQLAATARAASRHRRHTIPSLAIIVLLVATLLAACGQSRAATTHLALTAGGSRDAAQLFEGACASCHGPLGEGGSSGVPLNQLSAADRQAVIGAIRYGVGGMPASSNGMSDEQIEALGDYVAGLR